MGALRIDCTINGRKVSFLAGADQTLLEALREQLKLKGTKCGCGIGECGACTVILDGLAVCSCQVFVAQIDGCAILTIEGLGQHDELDPLQESFVEHRAVQCGFCTSGMLMSAKALLMSRKRPTREEIRQAISGNLCRCSDYNNIVLAIEDIDSE